MIIKDIVAGYNVLIEKAMKKSTVCIKINGSKVGYMCPACQDIIADRTDITADFNYCKKNYNYCRKCGQALKWED